MSGVMPNEYNNGIDSITDAIEQMNVDNANDVPQPDDMSLPSALIVTNVDEQVFQNETIKFDFEQLFRGYDPDVQFQYLRSFRRARVEYSNSAIASNVRLKMHEVIVCGRKIKCYFSQPRESNAPAYSDHLSPPPVPRQFLISPPASPPVGWEPVKESDPVIDYELLTAIANLAPGEAHELHSGSDSNPKIVVHICEDPIGYMNRPSKIQQTARPT